MYFHVYSFKLQIHAHIYRSFIRHHKMLGVRIAKRKTSLKSRAKANPCGTKLRARIFFGAGKFASQTYPAGELKSRGNPAKVSPANIPFLADNRRCCIFFVNAKQKETGHPNGCPVSFWTVIKKCELTVSTPCACKQIPANCKIHVENSGKQDYAGYRYQHQTAAGNF